MKKTLYATVEQNRQRLIDLASAIWQTPEKAHEEVFASNLQKEMLQHAGFRITDQIPSAATAFVAEYGSGSPILGVLGEYDALPGLSQEVSSRQQPIANQVNGHGCGHNLLGVAGIGAVLAIKEALDHKWVSGTVRYYGCPAEETLTGKVIMARAGVFNDLDACLTWHSAGMNAVWRCSFLAMKSVKFRFTGIASHAAAAPELGRSALDAVELMNVGTNYLREHVPEKARINYTITKSGDVPNIVPADAEVWYYLRAPDQTQVEDIFARVVKISQGAALMTETRVEHRVLAGCYNVLPNQALGDLLQENMVAAGAPQFSAADKQLAKELVATFPKGQKEKVIANYYGPQELAAIDLHEEIAHNRDENQVLAGSTDVGDVSWITPLAQFTAAAWPVGTTAHSWQATAASGSTIGFTAMIFAAKTLAGTLFDLLTADQTVWDKIKTEFKSKT